MHHRLVRNDKMMSNNVQKPAVERDMFSLRAMRSEKLEELLVAELGSACGGEASTCASMSSSCFSSTSLMTHYHWAALTLFFVWRPPVACGGTVCEVEIARELYRVHFCHGHAPAAPCQRIALAIIIPPNTSPAATQSCTCIAHNRNTHQQSQDLVRTHVWRVVW